MTNQQVEVNVNMNSGTNFNNKKVKAESSAVRVSKHNLNIINALVKIHKLNSANDLMDIMLKYEIGKLSHGDYIKLEMLMELNDDTLE